MEAFYRDTWIEINLDAIFENMNYAKKNLQPNTKLMVVVKANAYGHGMVEVAKVAQELQADYLVVAILDEALYLRKCGITMPILVLGAVRIEDLQIALDNNITLTAFRLDWVVEAAKTNLPVKIHLKLDTGMGRLGIREDKEIHCISKILKETNLIVEGVYTHFATADELESTYFEEQLNRFRQMLTLLDPLPKIIHSSNSAATILQPTAHFHAVRTGITIYGLVPSKEMEQKIPYPLQRAFNLKTKLVHTKLVPKGQKIGYGATYETTQEEWIGTLPIGYADGWIRKLQGQEVLINGLRCPIVGRICMDQCMVRLPYEMPIGSEVVLIGEQLGQLITVEEIADRLETINYEVVCMMGSRLPRIYKKNGKVVSIKNEVL